MKYNDIVKKYQSEQQDIQEALKLLEDFKEDPAGIAVYLDDYLAKSDSIILNHLYSDIVELLEK